jgi:hypothetical protein
METQIPGVVAVVVGILAQLLLMVETVVLVLSLLRFHQLIQQHLPAAWFKLRQLLDLLKFIQSPPPVCLTP